MRIDEFISHVGPKKLSEILNVTDATVNNWRAFRAAVPPIMAYRLILLSHNALNWENIYAPYIESALKEKGLDKDEANLQLEFPL